MDRDTFWRGAHARRDSYWLSGTPPSQIVHDYDLPGLPHGKFVTEIGVGLGVITRELHKTNVVTAVDIVPEAFQQIRESFDRGLGIHDLGKATPADWALCHLVFQHCEEEMVRLILRETPLAESGVFLFQTAYPVGSGELAAPDQARFERGELVWHSGDEVQVWAEQAGLEVFWRHEVRFADEPIGWTLFKAGRA